MGLYEGIKDVAKVMQQADNIDLCLKKHKVDLTNTNIGSTMNYFIITN